MKSSIIPLFPKFESVRPQNTPYPKVDKAQTHYLKLKKDLTSFSPKIKTTEIRREWFVHTISNAHSSEELIEIIKEFNQKQMASHHLDQPHTFDLIQIHADDDDTTFDLQAFKTQASQ